ncbi:MAG TPA: hypothetical protein PKC72_07050 [Chitinophagaceae bacterium]|nr:hypothetical protein [Chitinophagaceae bacterium]
MKTNAYRFIVIRVLLFILVSLYFITVFGQPANSYMNGNPIRVSSHSEGSSSNSAIDFSFEDLPVITTMHSSGNVDDVFMISVYNEQEKTLFHDTKSDLFLRNYCCQPFIRRLKMSDY